MTLINTFLKMTLIDFNNIVSRLPKELKMHVYMFNPEHRKMMEPVLKEMNFVLCDNCSARIPKHEMYYEYERRGQHFVYCSAWCISDAH